MGRRPRSHQSSGYGLTTMLVAGLAFVDSFNLIVRSPQHSRLQSNPRPCPSRHQRQRHVHRTTSMRSTCPATPRSNVPDGSAPPRITSERKVRTSQQSTPVRATRTRASASKAAVTRLSTSTPAAPGEGGGRGAAASDKGKDPRSNARRGKSREAASEESNGAAERKRKELQQKQRLQRSMGGLDERAMSRGQLVSSFALVGAAAAILGGSGIASASTEV